MTVRLRALACCLPLLFAPAAPALPVLPVDAPVMPLAELRAGMTGEVWTVFQGTEPEPFTVEVTGVIHNALGPGKSMILCQLTDDRVQKMGAVAGMSGSPLYIDGKLVGALSYQVQRFETVRYAGFTPVADLLEVRQIADASRDLPRPDSLPGTLPATALPSSAAPTAESRMSGAAALVPLTPVFTFGGLSPHVAALLEPHFAAVGLATSTLGGSLTPAALAPVIDHEAPVTAPTLRPGDAVAAALAVGDITLAGTGTVSLVDGDRVLAFGHPMMGLGTVEVPMAAADIVTILPSNLSSFKISNTGPVIGTVRQDRLSAIYGELGAGPELVPVVVHTPQRTLHFGTVRHPRLTPVIAAAGLTQAVLGSNDAALNEGFRVSSRVTFANGRTLTTEDLYAGPQGFNSGLEFFVNRLANWLQNPVEQAFPRSIEFSVEPLGTNPTASLDNIQLSRSRVGVGEEVSVGLHLRDFQSAPLRETLTLAIPAAWAGRKLEVIVAPGPALDKLAGEQDRFAVSQIRDFDAYLGALQRQRRSDGLYIAVVEAVDAVVDQTNATLELPGSLERVARTADPARFQRHRIQEPLWEQHVFAGRIVPSLQRRPLVVAD